MINQTSRMIHTFDNSELCILIKLFSIILAELCDKELTALFFRFSSNHNHATGIISQNVVDDVEIHSSMLQSESELRLTQKKFFPFSDRRKTQSPLLCSIMHSDSDSIRLQNLFFAFLDFGETKAVFMTQKCASE